MDDDVQYLGMKLARPDPLSDPCEAQEPVSGITLHIEKCGEKPAHDITFHRSRTVYVNIGRKSSAEDKSMRRENDDHNVVFPCQVVSAQHAKLFLSAGGQVYIIDLHSRHGTHLKRRGEALKTLDSGIETTLCDGDVLTFGKAVGAGSCVVPPVTARVELLRERLPLVASPSAPLTPISSLINLIRPPPKSTSGRYGLFLPAPHTESLSSHSSYSLYASSDWASSDSDRDSDIEELSCLEQTFSLPVEPLLERSTRNSDVPGAPSAKVLCTLAGHLGSPSLSIQEISPPPPVVVDAGSASKSQSRSHSPMELSTPSPSHHSEDHQSEPVVVGAWPIRSSQSPHLSTGTDTTKDNVITPSADDLRPTAVEERELDTTTDIHGGLMEPLIQFYPPMSPELLGSNAPGERVNGELRTSIKTIEDCISAMQETITDLETRQCFTEADVEILQGEVDMREPEPESDTFLSRLDVAARLDVAERNIASLSAFQSQVLSLKSKLEAPPPSRVIEIPVNDVKMCVEALSSLVTEMKSLRESAEKRIEERVGYIEAVRTDALTAIATEVGSLKRKRQEDEDQESLKKSEGETHVDIPVQAVRSDGPESPQRIKRARTAIGTVAHTAAVMAVGAMATWSALAFT